MSNEQPTQTTIYALCDPGSGTVRYIGLTTQSPERRLAGHLSTARPDLTPLYESRLEAWLRGLLRQGQQPTLRILEQVRLEDARAAEARWCARYSDSLVNTALPGALGRPRGPVQVALDGDTLHLTHPHRRGAVTLTRTDTDITITVRAGSVDTHWTVDIATVRDFIAEADLVHAEQRPRQGWPRGKPRKASES
jgi:hypothetical protein